MPLLLHRRPGRDQSKDQAGYVLMALLLMIALIIIFSAAIVPTIKYEIEHDREEEMIHRGVQYSRAIRLFYKKFGRYPVKIEDLENSNNMRFLRKRYTDPTSCHEGKCADFKLLHFGEVKLTFGTGVIQNGAPGMPGGGVSGALGNTGLSSTNGLNQGSTLGASTFGQTQSPVNQATPGSDSTSSSSSTGTDQNSTNNGDQSDSGNNSGEPNLKGFSSQTFGGGPIVGVVSGNKKEGYREFNHKKKYSEWQFIYDPGTDRGGLLMTPNQPPLIQQAPNVNGQNGQNNSGFGGIGGINGPNTTTFGPQNNQNQPQNGQPTSAPNDNQQQQ